MSPRLRGRSARRRAALRVLEKFSQDPPSEGVTVSNDDRSPQPAPTYECAGRPYLVGAGTLLVDAIMRRLRNRAR